MRALLPLVLFAIGLASAAEPQWESLFDGKTLQGWAGAADRWRVENGSITGEIPDGQSLGRNEFIYCDKDAADFELIVEYRITGGPSANSGIQIRSERHGKGADNWQAKGYQSDLDDGAVWLGRIYEEEGRALLVERGTRVSIAPDGRRWVDPYPFGTPESFKTVPKKDDWNTYEISARGPHIETRVNGKLFSALDDHQTNAAKYSGKIAFQLHSGKGPSKIEIRSVKIKHLGKTELPPLSESGAPKLATQGGTPVQPVMPGAIAPTGANGKPLNLNFESGTLDNWKAEGNAWEGQPIKGDTVSPRKPSERSNHTGNYWIGGYEKAFDAGTGTLTSDAFEVSHPYASFLVGGGKSAQTRVELVAVDGNEVIDKASGNDHEDMTRHVVDLKKWSGKKIFIRLVDEGKGGWGHINFDDFVFHDAEPKFSRAEAPVAAGKAGRIHESAVLWGLRPNPFKPATPPAKGSGEAVAASMSVVNGFQVECIAQEPDLKQPIAFTFDERGRIWVVEAMSYPTKRKEGQGMDRILILEDTKGDGKFDKRTVFTEGLNLVSGIEVGFGGVWVGAAPQLLFIPDKDRDDKPDGPPEVLLDGFGYQDTHETINSFIWGPDGWLYGNQGVFNTSFIGKPGTPRADRVEMRAGVWRYHPVRHQFEIFAHGCSNQWGLDYDEHGNFFITHCRSHFGGGGTSYVIRNGHYWNQADSNHAPFISNKAPAFAPHLKNYLPASSKYDDGAGGAGRPGTDLVYGGHAHSGTMIYQGDNWPEIYRGHLFTANLFGQQINHQHIVADGSGYEAMQGGYDMMYCPDPSYLCVALKYGPDGAVYMTDWSDKQHCHLPQEEKWDRSNGRMYRMSWAETYKPVKVDLGKMSDLELAQLQTHKNEWYARTARRLLMERTQKAPIAADASQYLKSLLTTDGRALPAMWTLAMTSGLNLETVVEHRDESVRVWSIRMLHEGVKFLAEDNFLPNEQRVLSLWQKFAPERLALAASLPSMKEGQRRTIAEALAMHAEDKDDRFLPKMIWYGIAPLVHKDIPRALALAAKTPMESLSDSIYWYACRTSEGRDAVAAAIADEKTSNEGCTHFVQLLAFSLSEQTSAGMPKNWSAANERLQKNPSAEAKALAEQLSALFGDKAILAKMRTVLADEKATLAERRRAFDLLKRSGDTESAEVFAGLLDHDAFRSQVLPLLSRSSNPAVAIAMIKRLDKLNEADRAAALGTLASRTAFATPLLQALEDKTCDRNFVTAFHVRQMLNLNDAALTARIEKLWGKINESPAEMKAAIAKYKKAFTEAPLWTYDATSGKKVFEKACMACHGSATTGGVPTQPRLGPDLTGSWRNGADYFLENIVDPNAVIGDQYRLTVIKKTDGTVVSGMFEKETDTTVLIKTTNPVETVIIPKAEVKQRDLRPQSVMPTGLLEALTDHERIELLKFLTSKR